LNQYQFLKQLGGIPKPGGDGVRVSRNLFPADLTTAAGLTLTAATVPTIANVETNGIAIVAAASGTANGSFNFVVPEDYDEVADELKLVLLVVSGGTTNTPTQTATAYRKRAGAALTAALTVVASSAIPTSTAKAAERTIVLSGNSLQAGDVLTVNLVSGAHTTDTVVIHSVSVQYKSSIVFNDPTNRSGATTA
jgi:hypothetical protein